MIVWSSENRIKMLVIYIIILMNSVPFVDCVGDEVKRGAAQVVLGGFALFVFFVIGVHCYLKRRERMKFVKNVDMPLLQGQT